MFHRPNAASLLLAVLSCTLPAAGGWRARSSRSRNPARSALATAPMRRRLPFNDASGQATGYSVDLCKRVATVVKESLKLADLKVTFVPPCLGGSPRGGRQKQGRY